MASGARGCGFDSRLAHKPCRERYMEKKSKKSKKTTEIGKGKFHALAILSYVPLLCFVTFFSFDKLDEFSKHHAKQGIILLIIEIISLLFLIDFVSKLFWIMILIICMFFSAAGIVKVLMKQNFQVPFLGEFLKKYDL